ncbi:hypothetical protein D3C79_686190 [compost metagenome]
MLIQLLHPQIGIVAVAAAQHFVHAAHAAAQFACGLAVFEVAVEEGLASRSQVGLEGKDGTVVIDLTVGGPAVELTEDVQRKGIDVFRRHIPPFARAAGAQVWWHVDGQFSRCGLPAVPQSGAQQC